MMHHFSVSDWVTSDSHYMMAQLEKTLQQISKTFLLLLGLVSLNKGAIVL
jgi:hypothetical protein